MRWNFAEASRRRSSADGSHIVYMDAEGLWTVNADGSNRRLLRQGALSAKEKVLVALTVFCFTEAIKLTMYDLLPAVVRLVAGILSP